MKTIFPLAHSLRFPGAIEKLYQDEYRVNTTAITRLSFVLGIVLYSVFAVLDAVAMPLSWEMIWLIRFAVVCPVFGLIIIATNIPVIWKYSQHITGLGVSVAGLSIVAMIAVSQRSEIGYRYYVTGLLLVVMWSYSFSRLRFWAAAWTNVLILLAFELVSLYHQDPFISNEGLIVFITHNFFFVTANVIGMFTGYTLEAYTRQEFTQKRAIELQKQRVEQLLARIEQELALAREIQQALLPVPKPSWANLDLACYNMPAHQVGGDFYAYHHGAGLAEGQSARERYVLALGDVSGKGMPAALIMSISLALFETTLHQDLTPSKLLRYLNTALLPYTKPHRQNCALGCAEITITPNLPAASPNRVRIRAASAGGVAVFLKQFEGVVEECDLVGVALGQLSDTDYQEAVFELPGGSMIILASDGVIEAQSPTGEMLGFDHLRQMIQAAPACSASAALDYLCQGVTAFIGGVEPHDDITLMVARV